MRLRWRLVDVALLVPADHLRALFDLQRSSDSSGCFLNLDLWLSAEENSVYPLDLARRGRLDLPYKVGTFGLSVRFVTYGSIFCTTKVPWPGLVSTSPRVMSHLIASRTVLRDAPYARGVRSRSAVAARA